MKPYPKMTSDVRIGKIIIKIKFIYNSKLYNCIEKKVPFIYRCKMGVVFMGCSFILPVLLIILFRRMLCSRRQQSNSYSSVVSILSQIIIRESVQTSSLSIQWQHLRMHFTVYPRLCRKEWMKHINSLSRFLFRSILCV